MLKEFKIAAYDTIKNGFTPDIYAQVFVQIAKEAINGQVNSRDGLGESAKI